MKKHLLLFVIASFCFTATCLAQDEDQPQQQRFTTPKWVSNQGYWVIESNVHTPKQNTVYFYNMDNILVYKEKVDGMKIKVNKKKVCMCLKRALEQAVTIWEATHIVKENEAIVAVALRQ